MCWYDNDTPFDKPSSLSNYNERSAIFTLNPHQKQQAHEYLNELFAYHHHQLYVDIEDVYYYPSSNDTTNESNKNSLVFYQAETYQQDYITKQYQAIKEQYMLWSIGVADTGLCPILE